MIRYKDIDPTLRAYLGAFQALRDMGFSSNDIYCEIAWSARFDRLTCFCTLMTQGKEFRIELGEVKDAEVFGKHQKEVTRAVASGEVSDSDLARIVAESEACQNPESLALTMRKNGFLPPSRLS